MWRLGQSRRAAVIGSPAHSVVIKTASASSLTWRDTRRTTVKRREDLFVQNTKDVFTETFKRGVWIKHEDKTNPGQPDVSFIWIRTTYMEFKHLGPRENIHDRFEKLQLPECIRYENACGTCWIVAFRDGERRTGRSPRLCIYRPRALKTPDGRDTTPNLPLDYVCDPANVLRDLRIHGVAEYPTHDVQPLVELILRTHKNETIHGVTGQ
jgi:hypothetical protein